MYIMLTMANIVSIINSDIAHTVHVRFTVFSNFSKLQFVVHILIFRNIYSGDANHANYGKNSLNHHFRHRAHSVYNIYSDFKLFEFPVCFAHFDLFEISFRVMRIMVTVANIV